MTAVGAEPGGEGGESGDVIGGASAVGARAVGVGVLVNIEDEVGLAAVQVGDLVESSSRAVVDKLGSVGPVIAGQQNQVLGGSGLADGGDSSLDGGGPGVDVLEIMGLVHDTESDLGLRSVLGGQLRPDGGELGVGGAAAAADDGTVPAGVVVEVDDTQLSAGVQAVCNLGVVLRKERAVEVAAEGIANEVLPADGETEGIELIILDEVVHLGLTSGAGVLVSTRAAVGINTEVEASDVDTGVLHLAL